MSSVEDGEHAAGALETYCARCPFTPRGILLSDNAKLHLGHAMPGQEGGHDGSGEFPYALVMDKVADGTYQNVFADHTHQVTAPRPSEKRVEVERCLLRVKELVRAEIEECLRMEP